jgi:S-DNA-T family DNA segregation ATPase FtsK/SpoIIIE
MAEDGIVGEYNGSQAREVLYTLEEWESLRNGGSEPSTTAKVKADEDEEYEDEEYDEEEEYEEGEYEEEEERAAG